LLYFDGEEALQALLITAMGIAPVKRKQSEMCSVSIKQAGRQHPLKIELKERE
jgi:hypothetical protein